MTDVDDILSDGASVEPDVNEEDSFDSMLAYEKVNASDNSNTNDDSVLQLADLTVLPPLPTSWPEENDDRWNTTQLPTEKSSWIRNNTALSTNELYICDGRIYIKSPADGVWKCYALPEQRSPENLFILETRLRREDRLVELEHVHKYWNDKRSDNPLFHARVGTPKRMLSPEIRNDTSSLQSRNKRTRTTSNTVSQLRAVQQPVDRNQDDAATVLRRWMNEGLEMKLKETEGDLDSKKKRLETLAAQHETLLASHNALKEKLAEHDSVSSAHELAKLQDENKNLELKVIQYVTEISMLKDDIVAATSLCQDVAKLKETIAQRDTALREFATTGEAYNTEIARLKETIVQRDTALREFATTGEAYNTEIARLNETIVQRDTALREFAAERVKVTKLKEQLHREEATNESLKTDVSKLTEQYNTLQKNHDTELRALRTELAYVSEAKKEAIDAAKMEMMKMTEQQHKTHDSEAKHLHEKLDAISNKHRELESELCRAQDEKKEAVKSSHTYRTRCDTYESRAALENKRLKFAQEILAATPEKLVQRFSDRLPSR